MQVLVAVARGVFAIALSFIFIDDSRANPVEVEADAGVITMVATVEAVDVTNRVVTLVGPNNNWVEVIVGPDKIKVIKLKEKITISYQDEVAVALRKVSKGQQGDSFAAEETAGMGLDAPTVAEQDWVTVTPTGATDLTTVEVTDTIAAINRNKRTISFAGTGGKTRTFVVGPNVPLDQLEVGDEVVLEATRAVAVDIKPV
jgi:Zn-dependent metalloprotease